MNMQGQTNERGVHVLSCRQVLSISDLDLLQPDHIGNVKHFFFILHTMSKHCVT